MDSGDPPTESFRQVLINEVLRSYVMLNAALLQAYWGRWREKSLLEKDLLHISRSWHHQRLSRAFLIWRCRITHTEGRHSESPLDRLSLLPSHTHWLLLPLARVSLSACYPSNDTIKFIRSLSVLEGILSFYCNRVCEHVMLATTLLRPAFDRWQWFVFLRCLHSQTESSSSLLGQLQSEENGIKELLVNISKQDIHYLESHFGDQSSFFNDVSYNFFKWRQNITFLKQVRLETHKQHLRDCLLEQTMRRAVKGHVLAATWKVALANMTLALVVLVWSRSRCRHTFHAWRMVVSAQRRLHRLCQDVVVAQYEDQQLDRQFQAFAETEIARVEHVGQAVAMLKAECANLALQYHSLHRLVEERQQSIDAIDEELRHNEFLYKQAMERATKITNYLNEAIVFRVSLAGELAEVEHEVAMIERRIVMARQQAWRSGAVSVSAHGKQRRGMRAYGAMDAFQEMDEGNTMSQSEVLGDLAIDSNPIRSPQHMGCATLPDSPTTSVDAAVGRLKRTPVKLPF